MPRKALVARRGAARTQTHVDTEITDLTAAGVTVLHPYPAALLVEGDDAAMARVVAAGFRVNPLAWRSRGRWPRAGPTTWWASRGRPTRTGSGRSRPRA